MTILVLLLAGSLAVAWGAGRATRPPPPWRGSLGVRAGWPAWPARAGWPVRAGWLARARPRQPPDLGLLVAEVASRLRAGATPEAAWSATVGRAAGGGAGREGARLDGAWADDAQRDAGRLDGARPGAREGAASGDEDGPPGWGDGVWQPPRALAGLLEQYGNDPAAAASVHTVVVASRLTHVLGAPLAEVLDRCAATVTEAQQAHDARRVALAGPRSTARILTGLPLLGLLLGAGLGADPVAAATDGGWGSASVVVGILLVLAGRRWTAALVAAAEGVRPAQGRTRRRGGA